MKSIKDYNILALCNDIESYVGRAIRTPKDFNFLREIIFSKTHQYISTTTLKRVWGYLNEDTHTRLSTLNLLSQFIGYLGWKDFCCNYETFKPNLQEGYVRNKCLNYTELQVGQIIEISWLPESFCTLEYLGKAMFRVLLSENSYLCGGDIVHCFYIIEGETFYFVNSIIHGHRYNMYYVGRIGGVKFKTENKF